MTRELEIIKNQKGGCLMIRGNGHRYTKNKTNANGTTLWRCVNRICSASATLDKDNQNILRESAHVCEPSMVVNEVVKKREELKRAVCEDLGPVPKIVEDVMKKLRKDSKKDADLIPTFNTMKDSLYRARKRFLNTDLLAHDTTQSITIPEVLAKHFLVCEDGDQEKNIVFSTKTARNIIKGSSGSFFADGTFKVTPKPFYQFYVLHLDLNSDKKTTNIIPVIYVLLPNKTEQTYNRLFSIIKQNFEIDIKNFKCDYEIAQMNAVSNIFPNAKISGCYYHFNHAVWKYSKKIKLNSTSEGRNVTRMVAMFPLLPESYISVAWRHILDNAPNSQEMTRFRRYFETQWFPKLPASILSCAGQRHRTTNCLEGWHRRINGRMGKSHSLYDFLFKLRKEAKFWDQRISDSLFKKMRNKRRLRDVTFDKKYERYLNLLENNILDLPSFFRKIIYLRLSLYKK